MSKRDIKAAIDFAKTLAEKQAKKKTAPKKPKLQISHHKRPKPCS